MAEFSINFLRIVDHTENRGGREYSPWYKYLEIIANWLRGNDIWLSRGFGRRTFQALVVGNKLYFPVHMAEVRLGKPFTSAHHDSPLAFPSQEETIEEFGYRAQQAYRSLDFCPSADKMRMGAPISFLEQDMVLSLEPRWLKDVPKKTDSWLAEISDTPLEEQKQMQMEMVVDHRFTHDGQMEFKIKWQGHDHGLGTWFADEDISCQLKDEYWRKMVVLAEQGSVAV
jgi:hypothetical protein